MPALVLLKLCIQRSLAGLNDKSLQGCVQGKRKIFKRKKETGGRVVPGIVRTSNFKRRRSLHFDQDFSESLCRQTRQYIKFQVYRRKEGRRKKQLVYSLSIHVMNCTARVYGEKGNEHCAADIFGLDSNKLFCLFFFFFLNLLGVSEEKKEKTYRELKGFVCFRGPESERGNNN